MKLTKLRIAGFKTFRQAGRIPYRAGADRHCRAERVRQVESGRGAALGDGREFVEKHARVGHGRCDFLRRRDRPARNMAEVVLFLDNSDRSAPALFNDGEIIALPRRIEREARLHLPGQRTRGARPRCSIAVRRRFDRRALPVDGAAGPDRRDHCCQAAGAPPDHRGSRGHRGAPFPPPRSRAASQGRRGQSRSPRRIFCGRSIPRPKALSGRRGKRRATVVSRVKIRRNEALLALIRQGEAASVLQWLEAKLDADLRDVAERTRAQAEAARRQAIAAQELPGLRSIEADGAAELQRLVVAHETLDGEERRAKSRAAELDQRIAQTASDVARETALIEDGGRRSCAARSGGSRASSGQRRGRSRDRGPARTTREGQNGPRDYGKDTRRGAGHKGSGGGGARGARGGNPGRSGPRGTARRRSRNGEGDRGADYSRFPRMPPVSGFWRRCSTKPLPRPKRTKTNWPSPKPAMPKPVPRN